jgi:Large polyvalent protein associated domain 22
VALNEYDDMMLNEKTQAPVPQLAAPVDKYDEIAQDESYNKKANMTQSMMYAAEKEPSRIVRAIKMAEELDVDVDFADRNMEKLEKKKLTMGVDYDALMKDSPGVADFMEKPENAAIGRDDMDAMKKIDQAARFMPKVDGPSAFAEAASGAGEYGKDIKQAGESGWNSLTSNLMGLRMAFDGADRETIERQAFANKRARELSDARPDYSKEFNAAMAEEGGDVTKAWGTFTSSFEQWRDGKTLEALKNFVVGDVTMVAETLDFLRELAKRPKGLGYSISENAVNSLPSMALGGAGFYTGPAAIAAVPIGVGVGSSVVEVGATMTAMLEKKGVDVTDPDQLEAAYKNPQIMRDVRAYALKKGITIGVIDAVTAAIGGKLFKLAGPTATKTEKLVAGAKATGFDMVTEAGGEAASQGVAEGDARKIDVGGSILEGFTSAGTSAVTASQGIAVRGELAFREMLNKDPIKAAHEVVRTADSAVASLQSLDSLQQLGAAIKETKNLQQVPGKIGELVEAATGGKGSAAVYFQTDEFDNYWKKKGESPAEAAGKIMGDDGKAYEQAKQTGGLLEIPLEQYASTVGVTEDYEGMLPITRPSADGMTFEEARESMTALPGVMKQLALEATSLQDDRRSGVAGQTLDQRIESKQITMQQKLGRSLTDEEFNDVRKEANNEIVKERAARIEDSIQEQLVAAGRPVREAKYAAQLVQKSFANMAERQGYTPEQFEKFISDYLPTVQTAGAPATQTPGPQSSPGQMLSEQQISEFYEAEDIGQRYEQMKGTEGGKLIDTDMFRELLPQYAESREGAMIYSAATDRAAGLAAQRQYEKVLKQPHDGGYVAILAGGPASGKSEYRKSRGETADADVTFDGTGANYTYTKQRIDQAIASGRDVLMTFVYNDFNEALERNSARFKEGGRLVDPDFMAQAHVKSLDTFLKLTEEYQDSGKVGFEVFDARGFKFEPMSIADLSEMRYDKDKSLEEAISELEGQANERLSSEVAEARAAREAALQGNAKDQSLSGAQSGALGSRQQASGPVSKTLYQSSQQARFVSKLEQTVVDKMGGSASADQIRGMLRDVKPEEMKWSGLLDFLKTKDKFTKTEIVDFLRANALQIQEVVKGEQTGAMRGDGRGKVHTLFVDGDAIGTYDNVFEAEREAENITSENPDVEWTIQEYDVDQYNEDYGGGTGPTKFETYVLPGGQNYREMLFILPEKAPAPVTPEEVGSIDTWNKKERPSFKQVQRYEIEENKEYIKKKKALAKRMKKEYPDMKPDDIDQEIKNLTQSFFVGGKVSGDASPEMLAEYQSFYTFYKSLQSPFPNEVMYTKEIRGSKYMIVDSKTPKEKGQAFTGIYVPHSGKEVIFDSVEEALAFIPEVVMKEQKKFNPETYKSSHWEEKNVLAHARVTDRVAKDGSLVFHTEENQSDWLQEGRKKGFKSGANVTELKAKRKEIENQLLDLNEEHRLLNKKFMDQAKAWAEEKGSSRYIDRYKELVETDEYSQAVKLIADKYAALDAERKELTFSISEEEKGVPDAPFKKNWHEFVFKRMIIEAVNKGYDFVSWSTGAQNSEHYNLEKQVDHVDVEYNKDGTYNVTAIKDRSTVSEKWDIKEPDLESMLGKDLARKIINKEGQNFAGTYRYKGDDLKIGGEGMSGFYDKILVDYARKFGKKYNAPVGDLEIAAGQKEFAPEEARTAKAFSELEAAGVGSFESFKINKEASDKDRTIYDLGYGTMLPRILIEHYKDDQAGLQTDNVSNLRFKNLDVLKEKVFGKTKEDRTKYVTVHSIKITDGLRAAAMSEGFALFQGGANSPIGQIRFGENGVNIDLLEGANPSTFIHEMGHAYMNILKDLGTREDSPQQVKDDLATILKHLGAESTDLTVEQEEIFARTFEAYLREGKAPSSALRKAFINFKSWLMVVYKSLTQLNVNLTPEVRDVFDRLLATEEEIAEARGYISSDFNLNVLDVPTEAQAKYLEKVSEWKIEAEEQLAKKLMAEYDRKDSQEYKKIEAMTRAAVENEVNQMKVYNLMAYLEKGQTASGSAVDSNTPRYRIDKQAIRENYPKGTLPKLKKFAADAGGDFAVADPSVIAALFGYNSGREMISALTTSPTKDSFIESLTEQRMNEQFPDMMNDEGMLFSEAIAEVHQDKGAEVKRLELEMIADKALPTLKDGIRKISGRIPSNKQIKAEAIRIIKDTNQESVRPIVYLRAERKFARQAGVLLARGDFEGAFEAKRKELYNYELYRAARDFNNNKIKKLKFFKKIMAASDESTAKTRDHNIVKATKSLLARYMGGDLKVHPMEHLHLIKKYDEDAYMAMEALIEGVLIPKESFSDMTVQEFMDVADVVQSLWDFAKTSKEIIVGGEKIEIETAISEIVEEAKKFQKTPEQAKYNRTATDREKTIIDLMGLKAAFTRVEALVDVMGETYRKYIFTEVSKAEDERASVAKQYKEKIVNLSKPIREGMDLKKAIQADEIKFEFKNKAELLGALLHTGNDSNKEKLLVGREWADQDESTGVLNTKNWDAFIERMENEGVLTKQDYDYIQSLWDLMEELKPRAQKSFKRIFGYYFDEITAQPFTNRFGTYRGGYAPAKIDPHAVTDIHQRQELENFIKSNPTFEWPASGGRGFTMSRVAAFKKPLSLELGLVNRHMDDVIRFMIVKPAVVDAAKIIMNPRFREEMAMINQNFPTDMDKIVKPALNRADKGMAKVDDPSTPPILLRGFMILQKNAAMQIMVGNVVNTLEQLAGPIVAMSRVDARYMARGMLTFMSNPRKTARQVEELSLYMRNRNDTNLFAMDKQARDIFKEDSAMENTREFADKHGYFLQAFTQNIVDNIVWQAAYSQALAQGLSPTAAVDSADTEIRMTQGGRRALDISAIEANQWLKFFNMFMGFFNMLTNLNVANYTKLYFEDMGMRAKFAKGVYLYATGFASVAIISGVIRKAAAGGLDADDDDEYVDDLYDIFIGSQLDLGLAMVPVVGPAFKAGLNQLNDKAYDDRVSASPAITAITAVVGTASKTATGQLFDDKKVKGDVRDALTALGILTGMPTGALSRPLSYEIDRQAGKARPTGPIDAARGYVTGKPGTGD